MPVTREEVLLRCVEVIASKKKTLLLALQLLEESLLSETKSSAGDKHETGRARLQSEQGKLLNMLNEILDMEKSAMQLSLLPADSAQKGSLVSTDKGLFFLGLSLGRLDVKGENVYSISAGSPLGAELKNKKPGESFEFREIRYRVLDVW